MKTMEKLHALFVKHHSEVLTRRVTSVMHIADALRDTAIIQQDIYTQILKSSTDVDKMTVLLRALSTDKEKSAFYNVWETMNPDLLEDLERQDAQFVDYHSADLIQRVTVVMPIADVMRAGTIIVSETYSEIQAKATNMSKMRVLLMALNSDKAKSALYNVLKDQQNFLVKELERKGVQQGIPRSSAQTSSEVQETESSPQHAETVQVQTIEQKTEEKQIPRWNKSSERHGTKLEELLKETEKVKVGNLYFYKDEKYMISPGGSGAQVYIGLSEDGIEVAIKLITKNPKNNKDIENEVNNLQKLESPYIVRYVTFVVGKDFYYLANQLCEYDLVVYMENLREQEQKDKDNALRKIVKEMLLGLQVLHRAGVIHRDIKPRNVLIDVEKRARLADFGISRKLEEGKSTVYTDRAGTRGWEATEILNHTGKCLYKRSSDIQVAGMLTYYILSDGKHPFGEEISCEVKICDGEYSLKDVRDKKATDLVEWMINIEQDKRPTIDKVLDHPYFWDDKRIREVLHNLGNKEEVQEYKNYESNKELYDTVQKYTEGKSFSDWKSKAPKTWTKIGKGLPNDLLGLLRYLRNALGHQEKLFYAAKMIDEFPDFLISLHRLATDMGWKY